jgi:ketosteroid isomerase-like protein
MARKALAGAFGALNRHDLAGFMSAWRDDGVFVYPGDIPESGTFKGRTSVEGWFRRFFEQFPTIQFDVHDVCMRDLFDARGTNTGAVHWDIRLVNRDGREGRNSGVTVITIERGKVVLAKDFIFDLGDNFRRNWGAL